MNSTQQGDFWAKAERPKQSNDGFTLDPNAQPPMRRGKKIFLFSLAAFGVVLIGVLLFLPGIVGAFAPRIVYSQASKFVNGEITLADASLSWSGPQNLKGLTISKNGKVWASCDVEVEAGLLSLALGGADVGTVLVSNADVQVIRDAAGVLNLSTLTKSASSESQDQSKASDPAALPDNLNVTLIVDNLDFSYRDSSAGTPSTVSIDNLDLRAELVRDQPIVLSLKSKSNATNISSDIKLSNWNNGSDLRFERAKVDASIDVSNLPTAVIDAFMPSEINRPDVRRGLGEVVSLAATVKGSRDQGSATFDLRSNGVTITGGLVLKDDSVSTASDLNIDIKGSAICALVPAVDQALLRSTLATLDAPPDVALRISEVRVPFSKGAIQTLRGAAARFDLTTSEFSGGLFIDGTRKRFRSIPMTLSVRTTDLATAIDGSLATDVYIDEVEGGSVSMKLSCGGVLDSKGMFTSNIPKDIRADVSVQKLSTALIQPFVTTTGLDLPRDLGPHLNCTIKAVAGTFSPGEIPPTTVTVDVSAQECSLVSQFTMDSRGIEVVKDSTRLELKSAGRLLSHLASPGSDWRFDPATGSAVLSVSGLVLPRSDAAGFAPHDARLRSSLLLKNLTITPEVEGVPSISLKDMQLGLSAESSKVTAELAGNLAIAGRTSSVNSNIEIPDLILAPREAEVESTPRLSRLRPIGRISFSQIPVDVLRLFHRAPALDVERDIRLIKGVAGDVVDLSIASRPEQGAGVFGVGVNMKSPKLNCSVAGRVSKDHISIGASKISMQVDSSTIENVLEYSKPNNIDVPTLSGASAIDLMIEGFELPLDASSAPVWSRAGNVAISIQSPGQTLLDGLKIMAKDGVQRDLGRAGFQNLKLSVLLPFQTLFGAGQPDARNLDVDFFATVIGPSKSPMCDLRLKGNVEIESAKPVGPLNLDVDVSRIDTRQLAAMVPDAEVALEAVGDSFDIHSTAVITPGKDRNPLNIAGATVVTTNELKSRGISTAEPLVIVLSPSRLELRDSAQVEFSLSPDWFNTLLASGDTKNASLALSKPATLLLSVSSFKIPRDSSSNLKIDCALSTPELRLMDSIGREISMNDLRFIVSTDDSSQTKPVKFSVEVKSAAVDSLATSNPIIINGRLDNVLGERGAFSPAEGLLTLRAELKKFPTVVVDTLADRKGMLVDLLGDVCDISASAERLPLQEFRNLDGRLFGFNLSSPRISTSLNGSITDSVFSSSSPLTVSVVEVTNGLTQRFIGAVPVLKKLEKQLVQSPATITERSLRIPFDSDMRKLSGAVVFDPGEVTYQVNPTLASLLKNTAIRSDGIMGNKLQPATVNFTKGVGVLEKYTLPLGEFSVGLEGKVDLVGQKVEMIVWLPASQLADAVTGKVTTLLSAGSTSTSDSGTVMSTLLELVPNWPFKVAGPLSTPASSLTLDTDRVLEEFKKNGGYKKLLERIGGSKLKDLLKPKDVPLPSVPK